MNPFSATSRIFFSSDGGNPAPNDAVAPSPIPFFVPSQEGRLSLVLAQSFLGVMFFPLRRRNARDQYPSLSVSIPEVFSKVSMFTPPRPISRLWRMGHFVFDTTQLGCKPAL